MIEANKLTKIYGNFLATKEISFHVGKGEVACFLGPNGAGKHHNENAHRFFGA